MNRIHQSLDRQHLQLLLAVRDTGSLARAADVLSISPSAASHRLREAERRLGAALTTPDGRSLALTPGGRHLADVASTSEASLRLAENTARWLAGGSATTVRLAAGFYDTAPWFDMLAAADDLDVEISVVRIGYEGEPSAVAHGGADLAIVVKAAASRPVGTVVAADHLAAVVPADHPAASRGILLGSDLPAARYLTAGDGPTSGFEHEHFMARIGAFPQSFQRIESVAAILRLVASGHGLSIQPRLALGPAARLDVAVVDLEVPPIPVRWEAVIRDNDLSTARVLDALRSRLSATAR